MNPLGNANDLGLPEGNPNLIADILPIVFMITGSLSVLFIIIGGLRYVLSAGDPKKIETAKNTIIYAIIGALISLAAFSIVRFVIGTI